MATTLRFQIRGDTAEQWEQKNTKLLAREIGYDSTNRRLKIGDGTRQWKDLPFLPPDVIDDLETGGSENALSAEQGKRLKSLVDGKAEKSDLTKLEQNVKNIVAAGGVSVIDKLDSTDKLAALSANQGRVLDGKITALQTSLLSQLNLKANKTELTNLQTTLTNLINKKADTTALTTLQTTLTTQINNSKVAVVPNLISTSATSALSASMGKKLNDEKLAKTEITTESWTFTLEDGSKVTKKVTLSK